MSDNGWVQLHRSINTHWIWDDPHKLKWWLDILLTVNHSEAKVLIGNTLVDCKRGQSINSLDTWARRWGVNKSKVRRFFILLENDAMIVTENVQKTTRITVCNYESYQGQRNEDETIAASQRNNSDLLAAPNNNDKKEINKNKKESISAHPFNLWILNTFKSIPKMKTQLTTEECDRLVKDFDSTTLMEICEAMENNAQLTKKYNSVNLTIRSWIRIRLKNNKSSNPTTTSKTKQTI